MPKYFVNIINETNSPSLLKVLCTLVLLLLMTCAANVDHLGLTCSQKAANNHTCAPDFGMYTPKGMVGPYFAYFSYIAGNVKSYKLLGLGAKYQDSANLESEYDIDDLVGSYKSPQELDEIKFKVK